jgi:GH25 family lysozyme M1 (1,4-beta-N-acetylmuramidase)
VLKGKQYEYPIWFDQEEKASFDTGKANCSAMVRAFCDTLEKAGYWAGLYMSRASLQDYIDDSVKSRYSLWVAEWGSKLNYSGSVGIWQHSEKGSVDGINGNVDLDICYKDFPNIIKTKRLNGWGKEDFSSDQTSEKIDVRMEINGKFFSGALSSE